MPSIYAIEEGSIQHGFSESRAKVQIFAGGYANGKTTALAVKGYRLAADYPGSTGLLARSTYPKLNGTLRRVFFKWCPPEDIKKMPTKDENTVILKNGSIIDFRYISQRGKQQADGQGTSNLLSATYDWIGVDQIEDPEITQKDFLDLIGRLRGDTPYRPEDYSDPTMPDTGPRMMMVTCNPTANWVFKELVNPVLKYKATGVKTDNLPVDPISGECIVDLFEGSTYTNAANLAPDYIRTLEAMYRGQMRKRFLKGEWAAFEGLIYPEYDAKTHGISREDAIIHLLDCVRRHVAIKFLEAYDFGQSNPTCYMFAFVDDWGRVIVLDGFYEPDCIYTKHRPMIENIRTKYLALINEVRVGMRPSHDIKIEDPINADPAIYKHKVIDGRHDTGHTVSDLLTMEGLKLRPANNDIVSGIAKVSAYIAPKDGVPHLDGARPIGPLLYVCEELAWFDAEIVNYYWRRDTGGRFTDMPQEHTDHAMDTTKYLLSFVPPPSEINPPKEAQLPAYMLWQEVEDNRAF